MVGFGDVAERHPNGRYVSDKTRSTIRIAQTFSVECSPEALFDYVTDPSKLKDWQTSKTSVEQLTEGTPGLGTRFRERTKPPRGKEFEQITEFVEFDRPSRLRVHIVEGPQPIDGTWVFEPDHGGSTRVHFVAAGELCGPLRILGPIVKMVIARQFAAYHRRLCRNLGSRSAALERPPPRSRTASRRNTAPGLGARGVLINFPELRIRRSMTT